ncbi:LysR family transcriptional regulator [Nocardia speluncae]|uniref:LysR family transcriptional regulator n=1 Tax=Nocardia speluncae TaxID=419477 RepID=A0A846XT43_9NOCA|nr:LysR family transcriptional regulator [Nocardia speluncae]NKY36724.1 LysR family transcriptional regulator [Nocardia speluncae]
MPDLPVRELECLLILAEELHFGRTAERLRVSQSRVSQLVAALERSIGTQLVHRTSRRVALTDFGAEFVERVRPVYTELTDLVGGARREARREQPAPIRLGFQGIAYETVTWTLNRFTRENPDVSLSLHEIPLGDPFGALLDGRVDAAVALLPVREPGLSVGFVFPHAPRMLAVGHSHPLAGAERIDAEALATVDLVSAAGPAPEYWRDVHFPRFTPLGAPITATTRVATLQEGMTLAATGRYALLTCRPVAERNQRADLRYVRVTGFDEESRMALIWRSGHRRAELTNLAALLRELPGAPAEPADLFAPASSPLPVVS